jgi:hypothetical protein
MICARWRRLFEPPEQHGDERSEHDHDKPGHAYRRMQHVGELEARPASLDNLLVPVVLRRNADAVDEHQADNERHQKAGTQARELERCEHEEHAVQSFVVTEMNRLR